MEMHNMICVETEHLTKKYGEVTVLNDITIQFESGKVHGLIGRNGSGKTMLMKCICGFVPATTGAVRVFGKEVGRAGAVPDNIGLIIETPGFLPGYSAYRNLQFLAQIRGKIGKEEIQHAISLVGLDPDNRKHIGKYSLGMRQRLGLAQAIMENPDLLILDEPMNGLDKDGAADMRKYLLDLKAKGKTILIASHSAEDISVLCDTVYEMDRGELTKIR